MDIEQDASAILAHKPVLIHLAWGSGGEGYEQLIDGDDCIKKIMSLTDMALLAALDAEPEKVWVWCRSAQGYRAWYAPTDDVYELLRRVRDKIKP